MFVGWIIVAVVIAALAVTIVSRRRAHDDVHSVEHYHRQLHTLEGINAHPAGADTAQGVEGEGKAALPESALRLTGSSTVRLTDPSKVVIPPVAPPKVAHPSELVKFDDARPPFPASVSALMGSQDRMMEAINHRPRRLAAPAAAVAAVALLIIVLLVTGTHRSTPGKHHTSATTSHTSLPAKTHPRTTPTTTPPLVSPPQATSAHAANYTVGPTTYSLVLSATSASCWVDATDTATRSILFTGVLAPGQTHTVNATGPVTVLSGAPSAFTAAIDGSAVTLPSGFQAPFTLYFVPTST